LIVLAECSGSISASPSEASASASGRVYVMPDPFEGASASISLDVTVGQAAVPTFQQVVGSKIYIDGVELDPKWIVSWQLDEYLDRAATWSMAVAARRDWPSEEVDPIGNPGAIASPPPGASEVDIYGLYVTATGAHAIRLLKGGQVDSGVRSGGVDQISGVDATGRYDRLLATLSLPAGHGFSRGAVLRKIFLDAGITDQEMSLPSLSPMYKPVDMAEQPALAFGFELARVEGHVPRAKRDGILTLERFYRAQDTGVTWTFGESAYLSGQSGAESSYAAPGSDVPTKITLSTNSQVLREECERRIDKTVNMYFEVFAYKSARYRQNSVGALTELVTDIPPNILQLRRRVTTYLEYDCETLISERVITEEPYRPLAAKSVLDSAGDPAGPPQVSSWRDGVFVDDGATAQDDSPAYLWSRDRFIIVSDVTTEHVYGDENGLEGAVKTLETRIEKGWKNAAACLKSRAASSSLSWDDVSYVSSRFLLHDRSGVLLGNETFQVISSSEREFFPTEDGAYYVGEREELSEIAVAEGALYLYTNGPKNSANETLMPVSVTDISYVPSGDSRHRAVSSYRDLLGRSESTTDDEEQDGHLPASEIREDVDPPAGLYETEEEADAARGSSRYDSQPIECTVDSPLLLSMRQENHVRTSEVWPETQDELCALALQELREGAVGRLSITLPANFLVQPGHRVRWISRLNNLDLYATVDHVGNGLPGNGSPMLTTVDAKVYTF